MIPLFCYTPREPRHLWERIHVALVCRPPAHDSLFKALQLSAAKRREDVGHSVVVPDHLMLVVSEVLLSLGAELARQFKRLTRPKERATSTGRDYLVAVETKDTEISMSARHDTLSA